MSLASCSPLMAMLSAAPRSNNTPLLRIPGPPFLQSNDSSNPKYIFSDHSKLLPTQKRINVIVQKKRAYSSKKKRRCCPCPPPPLIHQPTTHHKPHQPWPSWGYTQGPGSTALTAAAGTGWANWARGSRWPTLSQRWRWRIPFVFAGVRRMKNKIP